MTEILSVVAAVASVATAIGVFIAAMQLRMTKQQSVTAFEDQVAGQYREIARRLPVGALLGEPLTEIEQQNALTDFYHYFDLSNEQAYLYKRTRISDATWREWSDGISQNLRRPAFAAAWAEVQRRAPESFNELREHFATSASDGTVPSIIAAAEAGSAVSCRCCSAGLPVTHPRICPECGHRFQGNGWDGIDAHWRSRHADTMPYETFWATLCAAHRA